MRGGSAAKQTHAVTAAVMRELQLAGHPVGAALIWHSRQAGPEIATLFFEPPMHAALQIEDGCNKAVTKFSRSRCTLDDLQLCQALRKPIPEDRQLPPLSHAGQRPYAGSRQLYAANAP